MKIGSKISGWLPGVFAVFLLGFVIFVHVRLHQFAFDDAFIHFRIARNFINSGAPYFNTGEMVKVSSSTGWMVFLTLLYGIARLFHFENNFPLFISIINAFITFGGMIVYTKIVELLLAERFSITKKLLFGLPYLALLLPVSIGLMETPFALLIAGLGIYLVLQSKPSGFLLLGFAASLRLELLVLVAVISIFSFFKKQFRLHQVIGYIAAGIIPFFVFDLIFFHTVIPQSLPAKSTVYSIEWYDTFQSILFNSFSLVPSNNLLIYFFLGFIFLWIVIFSLVRIVLGKRGDKSDWFFVFYLWSVLIMGGYIAGKTILFEWYIPLYTIPLLTVFFLLSYSTEQKDHISRGMYSILVLTSLLPLAQILIASIDKPGNYILFEAGARVKMYQKIGNLLNTEYPYKTLLTSEIGALGYTFQGEILDAAGLASPGSIAYHPMKVPDDRPSGSIGGIPPGYVEANLPDLIVSYDVFAQALLKDNVINQYNIIQIPAYLPEDAAVSKKNTIWSSKYLGVYVRKDLPVSKILLAMAH